ncbi:hypothetical protein [Lysinibacillus sp. NPDC086135]|uniref:hypothetical protein n=1 Tax=Lysinibacillus sp. NPDC086135 TaxID=3364130 RepID=UPI00382E6C99
MRKFENSKQSNTLIGRTLNLEMLLCSGNMLGLCAIAFEALGQQMFMAQKRSAIVAAAA